jgi:hypothetical protein
LAQHLNQPDWTEKSGLLFNIINIEAYEPANPSVLLIILKDRPELTTRDAKNIELVPIQHWFFYENDHMTLLIVAVS